MPDVKSPKRTAGWTKVAFGDVVRLCTERSSDPEADGFERYIGLEHLDPGELRVRRWGEVADGVTFTNVFRPGQVLFGKRRAYQRKVAVADFSGVCSGDIYVLEPKGDALLPELLPFICQTDAFFEHAVGTSAGSLSPRTNWESLADFEFALPPNEAQRRMVKVLRAASQVVDHTVHLLHSAEGLFQSKVDHVFVGAASKDAYKVAPLADLSDKIVDGVHKRPDYVSAGVPFLTVENLTRGPGIDFTDTRFITRADHEEFTKRANPERGDVLISKDGTLGIPRVVQTSTEFSIFVSVAMVKPKRDVLDPWFLRFYFESSLFKRHIASRVAGSALKHIHLIDLRESPIPALGVAEQRETAAVLAGLYDVVLSIHEREQRSKALMREVLDAVVAEGV